MAENVLSRKQEPWMAVSCAPDVCKTPMGSSTPPVPYSVVSRLDTSLDASEDVHANDGRVQKHDRTVMPTTEGDEPGSAKGVVSGTVGQQSWSQEHSPSVRVNAQPVVRHGDRAQMNGDKPAQDKADKKARYRCRKEQIEAGKNSGDPATQKAAERFERNTVAAEKAALSDHAYNPSKPAPTGWRDITEDREALARYGLTPGDLEGSRPEATRLYEPDPDVFGGDQRPTVAFRGTQGGADWKNNFAQGLNIESPYYRDAVRVGNTLGGSVDYTGHSLGGGLASAAATAGGSQGWTFNAAGLHSGTVTGYGGTERPADIAAYRVDDELLTGLQEQGWKGTRLAYRVGGLWGAVAKIGLSALMPNAVGKKHDLPGSSFDPYHRHLMPDVIKGIERQKQEDQRKIAAKTGKKC
ncbi:phospholipase [Sorangium cellulosum]|uniref:Phospholipase n=1 Tax=Sorangium cellulosum TaxID=56 RepID=A0A2L0EXR7_SORCE|nr:DUF4150 domain-containing protein [Sorangium cellulosum]AUX44039.1 phospholipase [Sorangium cellulosum]